MCAIIIYICFLINYFLYVQFFKIMTDYVTTISSTSNIYNNTQPGVIMHNVVATLQITEFPETPNIPVSFDLDVFDHFLLPKLKRPSKDIDFDAD